MIGGETAEMPGFYPENEYDLAGFSTGIVDKGAILDNSAMVPGDVIIALRSSGVHSNGFSLVRKVIGTDPHILRERLESLGGKSIGEALLEPTRIYVKPMTELFKAVKVKGVSHITGGGFYENIPRSIPKGLSATIDKKAVITPPIFDLIMRRGNIPERDMFNTFNMGVGMVAIVAKQDAEKALSVLAAAGEAPYVIGEVREGDDGVVFR